MIKRLFRWLFGWLPYTTYDVSERGSSGKIQPTEPPPPPPGSPRALARETDIGRPPHKPAKSVAEMLKTGDLPPVQRAMPGNAPEEFDDAHEIPAYSGGVDKSTGLATPQNIKLEGELMAERWLYVRDKAQRLKVMKGDRQTNPTVYAVAIKHLEKMRQGGNCRSGRCGPVPTAKKAAAHETLLLRDQVAPNLRDAVVQSALDDLAAGPSPLVSESEHPIKTAIDRARGRMEPPQRPVQFDGPVADSHMPRVTDLGVDDMGRRQLLVEPPQPLERVEVDLRPYHTPSPVIDHDSGSRPSDTGSSYTPDPTPSYDSSPSFDGGSPSCD